MPPLRTAALLHWKRRRSVVAGLTAFGVLVGGPVIAGVTASGDTTPTLLVATSAGAPRAAGRYPATEWTAAGGGDGAHFAPLTEIAPDNVNRLRVAWVYRTGDVSDGLNDTSATSFQATPVMAHGTLYFPTPFSRVVALDAETGAERWVFDPGVDRSSRVREYVTSRGVALWSDARARTGVACAQRVFVATVDARLIAVDAHDGERCASFGSAGEVNLRDGVPNLTPAAGDYKQSSPPAVIGDLVVVGSSIRDNALAGAPSGLVRAFDARTGAQRWHWEPLVSLVTARESGSDSAVHVGAANAWATITVDSARNLVFVPTGSASPDHYGGLRPGDNRHANSVVALDAATGREVWGFQLVHHDLWDYDVASQPALATLVRDGTKVPVLITSSKASNLFVLNRATGEPFFPVEERPVPPSDIAGEFAAPTQPFSVVPRALAPQRLTPDDAWGLTPLDRAWCRERISQLRSDDVYTPPSLQGSVVFPGFVGGMAWGGYAVDSDRGLLVTTVNRLPSVVTLVPRDTADMRKPARSVLSAMGEQRGAPYAAKREILLSPLKLPCSAPPWGTLVGVDLVSGDVRWEVPLGTMRDLAGVPTPAAWGSVALGGPLATASGVVFVGATMDRRLRAFDIENGALLWEAPLPASAQATPMTYRARAGGRQYVVIAAGGHAAMKSAMGDYLVAFALP